MRDDIVTKHIQILLNHRLEVGAKCLDILHKVGVDVFLHSTDAVVILYKAAAGGLFHDIEHVFTVAHTIEESCQGTEILCKTPQIEQVGIDTLKLVHDGTNVLDTIGELHTHSLFYDTTNGMTSLHSTQIIHAVGQSQCLRISITLTHFLNTAVDISQMGINLLDGLTVENGLKAKHTVGGRMLRSDIDNEVVIGE